VSISCIKIKSKNSTRLPLIQNHHHLALQDVGDKMVVMQDGGDLVTILKRGNFIRENVSLILLFLDHLD
jgi:hypothetical protein